MTVAELEETLKQCPNGYRVLARLRTDDMGDILVEINAITIECVESVTKPYAKTADVILNGREVDPAYEDRNED